MSGRKDLPFEQGQLRGRSEAKSLKNGIDEIEVHMSSYC